MHNYKELFVWKRAIKLCAHIYKLSANFPNEERFGLISQMRRASVSVLPILLREEEDEQIRNFCIFFE
ncbi:four helix bundle protein [Algoriphagus sp. C2-6-M1]|uniref:four helix bundle protein n=1 Tax=Algoriphagus persicinus TaxID=3108754 RepID=UPI002B387914|nr:four helix bundle protein [Algoriphagus sp. C2-6-M1]MEB2778895.1 four helix bundle protein [Algoriphagus sp. C2-6-M1]